MSTYSTEEQQDKVILFGTEDNYDELEELAKTAGCEVLGYLNQNRDKPHNLSYLGKGKVEELHELATNLGANAVICDDELSNAQLRHLTKVLDVRVMDRTMLILDIFATNAKSAEAIAQVEIAQQRYNLGHLTGMGINMSRIGGSSAGGLGIGTRGPGEKKLELDRRAIRDRITELERELDHIETHRGALRKSRVKSGDVVLSLVGYTNAGKSTLMNQLSNAMVLEQNRLFSTLDTTTRKVTLVSKNNDIELKENILLTDTVGFIQKLPHTLIKAFRSTLEELVYSHVLLHVVDVSNPAYETHMDVVYDTLTVLNADNLPIITVFNKIDKAQNPEFLTDERATGVVKISAKTGENIEGLIQTITEVLDGSRQKVKLLIPHAQSYVVDLLHKEGKIISKEYLEDGVHMTAYLNDKVMGQAKAFIVS